MDNKELLKSVTDRLEYLVIKDMLVKPLEDEYVSKEIISPIPTGNKDEDGVEEYDSESKIEEVLTTFRKGIVLASPSGYQWADPDNHPKVGDIVVYPRKAAIDFDLFKDSQLVNPYNIVAYIEAS